jgi:hypothetical protein
MNSIERQLKVIEKQWSNRITLPGNLSVFYFPHSL